MHNISNWNKFQDSYQVLEKDPRHYFLKKIVQGFIKNV
jgi:hypothetical protein